MNTQQYLQRLDAMSDDDLLNEIAKNNEEAQRLAGSARKLAEYKLHLSREELNDR